MLLIGSQALPWCYPDSARQNAAWEAAWDIWVPETEQRTLDLDSTEILPDDVGDLCTLAG